jgi:hypothetical protein
MTTVLRAADLTPAALLDLLAGLAPGRRRVWLEAPDGWALAEWPGLDGDLPWCGAGREHGDQKARATDAVREATAGRLFAPSGELRWRVLPALRATCCRTVYLGDPGWAPATLAERDELAGLTPRRGSALLWGRQSPQTPDEWVELRVPHRFKYPLTGPAAENVQAVLEVWEDARGEAHFVRLCDLVAHQGD